MSNLWLKSGGWKRGPQHNTEIPVPALIDRNIDVRNAVDIQPIIFNVFNNTDDRHPWLPGILSKPKPAAQRIAIRPVAASGGFIDNCNPLFAVFVGFRKRAAAQKRSLHHSKIIGAYTNYLGAQILRGFHWTIFNRQRVAIDIVVGGGG